MSSIALAGCSALIEPDESRLGGEDAEPIRLMDSGSDADVSSDAGPPVDAGPIDAGPIDAGTDLCTPGCVGDVAVSCPGGVAVRTSCQDTSAYCEGTGCVPWVCTPGQVSCTSDRTGIATCNERGSDATIAPCAGTCDPTTGGCVDITPVCTGTTPIALGSATTVDLCDADADDTFVPAGDCDGTLGADSGDAVFVLTLARMTTVEIELSDADFTAAIDTIVYVRRVCGDASSQIACDDDVPCAESTLPLTTCNGSEVRQSRIVTTLGPGTYYIVADAFSYSTSGASYGCGRVRLEVSTAG